MSCDNKLFLSFNRTLVELKLPYNLIRYGLAKGFNRTLVELK